MHCKLVVGYPHKNQLDTAIINHKRDRGGSEFPIESYLDFTLLSFQGQNRDRSVTIYDRLFQVSYGSLDIAYILSLVLQ